MFFTTVLLHFVFIFLAFLGTVGIIFFIGDRLVRAKGWKGPVTDHFDGKHFHNIETKEKITSRRGGFWKWVLTRPPNTWVWRDNARSAKPKERSSGKDLVVTMVGHASLLIQTEGLNILTDPIWSERASPFTFIGPKRYRDPGVSFTDLPPIDVVIISHNHYDHMDIPTLKRINAKWNPKIIVGLGNKEYLEERGVGGVTEIDWWDKENIGGGVNIVSVAAQHFSSRAHSDRDTTLWGGYVIETIHGNVYFAGDTGYGPFIGEIAKRYSSFRLAMIPIGAFKPEFFMKPVHVSPKEALQMAVDLSAEVMIPMHYGTFHLADDLQDEPLETLTLAIKASGTKVEVRVLSSGEETVL